MNLFIQKGTVKSGLSLIMKIHLLAHLPDMQSFKAA